MKAVLIEQLVKENELMKKKLQQIFLDNKGVRCQK